MKTTKDSRRELLDSAGIFRPDIWFGAGISGFKAGISGLRAGVSGRSFTSPKIWLRKRSARLWSRPDILFRAGISGLDLRVMAPDLRALAKTRTRAKGERGRGQQGCSAHHELVGVLS